MVKRRKTIPSSDRVASDFAFYQGHAATSTHVSHTIGLLYSNIICYISYAIILFPYDGHFKEIRL